MYKIHIIIQTLIILIPFNGILSMLVVSLINMTKKKGGKKVQTLI